MAIVYFGTFDPFHENHFRLVEHVARQYRPRLIAIVPNGNNGQEGSGFKHNAMSLDHRYGTVVARLKARDSFRNIHRSVRVTAVHPGDTRTDWNGRKHLCYKIGKNNRLPILFILVGSDSLESSLHRVQATHAIVNFPFKILTLPRKGHILPPIPADLADKIVIDKGYNEQLTVSSTQIRDLINREQDVPSEICHPDVIGYIREHKLYVSQTTKGAEQAKLTVKLSDSVDLRSVVILVGSPGSGKTTIAEHIASSTGHTFISTGDIYRTHQSNNTKEYKELERCRKDFSLYKLALGRFIILELHKILSDMKRPVNLVIEGFKAGDLTAFSDYIKPVKLNQVIIIEADPEIATDRLMSRTDVRVDRVSIRNRVTNYHRFYKHELLAEIKELNTQGIVERQIILGNNGPITETLEQLTFGEKKIETGATKSIS